MLSTVLNNVVSYFAKGFFVASFLPMLAFIFFNGVALYLLSETWHNWLDRIFVRSAAETALVSTIGFVAILLAAYAFSGLNNFFRRLMEGNWYSSLAHLFTPMEEYRLARLERRIEEAARNQRLFEERRPTWTDQMTNARTAKGDRMPIGKDDLEIGNAIRRLQRRRSQNKLLLADEVEGIVAVLSARLRIYDTKPTAAGERSALDRYHAAMHELVIYGAERAGGEHLRLHNERYSDFGTHLAPTRMGNIANGIQGYAERRYNCNLAVFLSQLLRCVQKDANAYAALQDARVHLDFLIACSWLTLAWSVIWATALAVFSPEPLWFLAVALCGPALAYWWYLAAAEQYRAFADILKTSLDMFRFDILKDLRLSLPSDVDHERRIWDSLNRLTLYADAHDENFRYRHPGT